MSTLRTVLLNDGNRIPWVAFGTGSALFGRDATNAIKSAIQNGLTHLDGAQLYRNEDTLGAGIAASGVPRSSLFVTTKLATIEGDQTPVSLLKESLKKLQVDYVDLYLIHSPTHHEGRLKEVWKSMEEAKATGLAKSIGVSNFNQKYLDELLEGATVVPAVNQIEFHPYVLKQSRSLLEYHKQKGIVSESYAGLTSLFRATDGPLNSVLERIRAQVEYRAGVPVTSGQVLTKWMLQNEIVVVTTTSKESRMQEILAVEKLPDLTAEEVKELENAGESHYHRGFAKDVFGKQ